MPKRQTFEAGQIIEPHGWKVVHPDRVKVGADLLIWVICPVCGKDVWKKAGNLRVQKACGCTTPPRKPVVRPKPPKRPRAPYRRQFYVGEKVGNGWTVLDSELEVRGTQRSHYRLHVRCHCGRDFWVTLANMNSQDGCGCGRGKFDKHARKEQRDEHNLPELDLRYWRPYIRQARGWIKEETTAVIIDNAKAYWALPQEVRDADTLQRSEKIQNIAKRVQSRLR